MSECLCQHCGQELPNKEWNITVVKSVTYKVSALTMKDAQKRFNEGEVIEEDVKISGEPHAGLVRYALMTRANGGRNPEYKYWTHRITGKALKSEGGCYVNFMDAVAALRRSAEKEKREVFLVGIFDGIDERGQDKDKFADVRGLPIQEVKETDEVEYAGLQKLPLGFARGKM